jgi:cytochrome b subunit of formate dehydrogenase
MRAARHRIAKAATRRLQRHPRRVRWFHAAVYLVTLPLLFTGWWILAGGEGSPSLFARVTGTGDSDLHIRLGWALAVLAIIPVVLGWRGVATFARETVRFDRGDGHWWARWPMATFTGRFGHHDGQFDPGQRIANVVLVGGIVLLTITGTGMTLLHGGSIFAWLAKIHRWTTFAITPVIAGHILIASGVLPGYRGVWRSIHLGGRVPESTAKRIWPGWSQRTKDIPPGHAQEGSLD